jgi:hypothetical protein
MPAAAPTPLGVLLSVDPRRTRSPRNPAAAAETELIAEAATLVIRQAALAEPGSHVAPERPVTLRLPRSGSCRDWPFRCSLNGRTQVTSASAESQDPHFNWITAPGPAERKTGSFEIRTGQWQ